MSKQRNPRRGGFIRFFHRMTQTPQFRDLSSIGTKLLVDLLSQYRGSNNGDLSMAWPLMSERGWKSKATLYKARKELITGNWIVVSRQGGLNRCSLYAVTFEQIDECNGKLELITKTDTAPDSWKN